MAKNQEQLIDGLVAIQEMREDLADFLNEHHMMPADIIRNCDANGWEDGIAYDLREAMFMIGTVVAQMLTWERDLGVEKEVLDACEEVRKTRKQD